MYSPKSLYENILDLPYGFTTPFKLFDAAKDSLTLVQRLTLQRKLTVHNGCVNSVCWNERGDLILSGSDDQHLCVSRGYDYSVSNLIQTGHKANIFSARFLPNTSDNHVVSCSGDGMVIFSDLQKPETSFTNVFNCHFGTAYKLTIVPGDSHSFLSCGEDGTVRWFDLRIKNSCSAQDCKEDILINCRSAVTTLAVNPLTPYHLGVGCSDSSVRIFDRRMLGTKATGSHSGNGIQAMISRFTVPEFEGQTHRVTSLSYSPDGSEMLVSYSSDYIYLFDVKDNTNQSPKALKKKYGTSRSTDLSNDRPLMKRLRVRGDWSDTGPNARPESENTTGSREQHSHSLHANLLQRMSDVLTRMFNNSGTGGVAGSMIDPAGESQPPVTEAPTENVLREEETQASSSTPQISAPLVPSQEEAPPTTPVQNEAQPSSQGNLSEDRAAVLQSLQEIRDEINSHSQRTRNPVEPLFSLTFSGHGAQSGVISIDTGETEMAETNQVPETTVSEVNDEVSEDAMDASPPLNSSFHEMTLELPTVSLVQSTSKEEDKSTNQVEAETTETSVDEREEHAKPSSSSADASWESSNDEDDEEETEQRNSGPSGSVPTTGGGRLTGHFRANLFHSIKKEMSLFKDRKETERNQMMSMPLPRVKAKFVGHRNARTMIKESNFWGNNFVMSGSDCGHIFVWDRHSTELVMILEADHHVVNCLQPHPFNPILASSGIDYDVKLWSPTREEPFFDEKRAQEIMERNKVMLEETKDTITVPASFMIRMLASLNHLRSTGGSSVWRRVAREARDNPDQAS